MDSQASFSSTNSYSPTSSPENTPSPAPNQSFSNDSLVLELDPKLHKRLRSSWVYRHMPSEDVETRYTDSRNRDIWRCKYCTKFYTTNGGTTIIKKHLLYIHQVGELPPRESQSLKRQLTLKEAQENTTASKRRKQYPGGDSIEPDMLERYIVKLLVSGDLAFQFIKLPAFRDLCHFLNQDIDTWLPTSPSTAKIWIIRAFREAQIKLKSRLEKARSKIHLCADVWTSPNNLPILGITSQFVSEKGKLEHAVLGMKEVQGGHSGVNLCSTLLGSILQWDIKHKIGYFQADNALNNNTLVESLETGKSNLIT